MSTINKKAVRELLLATAKKERPFQKITRVGDDAYPKVEAAIRRAAADIVRAMSRSGQTINILVAAGCLGFLQAGEPLTPVPLLPQPVLVIQQTGQLVITDKSPVPVMVIQRLGQVWTTSEGRVLMPLNLQQKEGGK
jgi:hypothetical protein